MAAVAGGEMLPSRGFAALNTRATAQHRATALKSERLFPFQRIDRLPIRTRRDENELLGPLHEEPRWGVHILDAREQLHGTREFAFAPACQRLGIGLRVRGLQRSFLPRPRQRLEDSKWLHAAEHADRVNLAPDEGCSGERHRRL